MINRTKTLLFTSIIGFSLRWYRFVICAQGNTLKKRGL
jgi:hypothetical protein